MDNWSSRFLLLLAVTCLISQSCLAQPEVEISDKKDEFAADPEGKLRVDGELSEEQLKKERADRIAALPYSHPPPDQTKTRLLIYEYDAVATVHVHHPAESEDSGIKVETRAKYHFELLNHDDHGNILARYSVYECQSGPCDNVPDIYVYFVIGGQNILGVYVKEIDEHQKPDWGLTLAIAYAIQSPAISGAGDEQVVRTPFGRCRHFLAKPDNKIFTRKLDLCDFDSENNHTLVPGLVNMEYQQFVEYKQNKKIDADMVFIETDEQFFIQSSFDPETTLRVHSHLSLEMMNRTRRYMKRYCPIDMLGDKCAKEIFGAKFLGKNWIDVNKKLRDLSGAQNTLPEFIGEKRDILKKCATSQICPDLFRELVHSMLQSTPEVIIQELKDAKNKPVLPLFLNAIAVAGPTSTWKQALEHALLTDQNLAQSFVDNMAFTTTSPTAALKEIMKWSNEKNVVDVYNTVGYLTQRRCLSTPSLLNSCNLDKDGYLNVLLKNDAKLTPDQLSKALWHLNFKSTSTYFSQFLCSNHDDHLQERALSFYNKVHHSFFDRSINMKLLKIFWNSCPKKVPQAQSATALTVLIRIAPDHPTVGSFLLRSETNNPANHNLWSLFYQKVAEAIQHGDHSVRRYWNELRVLRPFRPNYLQRSLNSFSSSIYQVFENTSIPLRIKGSYLTDGDLVDDVFISASSYVPLLSVQLNQQHQTVNTLAAPQPFDQSVNNQKSLFFRQFSQKIRLLAGYTLDLSFDVVSSQKLTTGSSFQADLHSSLSFNVKAEILDQNRSYGRQTHGSTIDAVVQLKNNKVCPIIEVQDASIEQTFVEKETTRSNALKIPGFSLNLGKNVNKRCH